MNVIHSIQSPDTDQNPEGGLVYFGISGQIPEAQNLFFRKEIWYWFKI